MYIVVLKLQATKSNIFLKNIKIGNWYFQWENNVITAFSRIQYSNKKDKTFSVFSTIQSRRGANLALLLDVLTFSVNTGANADIAIESHINGSIYKISHSSKLNNIEAYKTALKTATHITLLQEDEWPLRVNPSVTVGVNEETLKFIEFLLKKFSKRKKDFNATELKLLNYWRRGTDLEGLNYWDESYLSFFKILEYFGKRSKLPIPADLTKSEDKNAFRIINGAGLKKATQENYELVSALISIRNNWDIAHSTMKNIPDEQEGALYYTFFDNYWNYHHDAKQLSRFFILKFLGFKGFYLIGEGGVLNLVHDNIPHL